MPPKAPATKKTAAKPATKGPVGAGKKTPAKSVTQNRQKVTKPAAKGTVPAKGKVKEPAKAAEKKWTAQDTAARTIQTKIRQFLAKRKLKRLRKEKEDYEELMKKLEHEALMKIVKMQQEELEREHQKEEEERRRKREAAKRIKRILEAAFDGDNDEIELVLKEVADLDTKNGIGNDTIGKALRAKHQMAMVECTDANDNTPLSEAANGGHASTLRLLLERGADPNSIGNFKRTPLYRAAFSGHLEATQVLLEYGADPRIYASDGQTPENVASQPPVQEVLANWDISQTESLLTKLEAEKERRKEEERKRHAAETNKLEDTLAQVQKEYESWQKQLEKVTCELNKRIEEHDLGPAMGFDRPDITLQAIHDAEVEAESVRVEYEKARDKLAKAKLELRIKQAEGEKEEGVDSTPGIKVLIRELDDVLLRDVGNKISDSGKWPLIIDPSGQAAIFIRYRDTNYMNALSPSQMQPEKIRLSLMGAIRFGKPAVLDMMEIDMFETVATRCDEIQKGLLASVMDKSILENENYLKLIREGDGDQYDKNKFNDFFTRNFKFWIITKNPYPPDSLLDQTYPIRVIIPT